MPARSLIEPELRDACRQAVLEVLELMFFEIPLEGDSLEPGPSPDSLTAEAGFTGSIAGRLRLSLSTACTAPLAAAFLGLDQGEVDGQQKASMIIELTNMVCGATLSRLQPAGTLRIHQPRLSAQPATPPDGSPWMTFPLSCGVIQVSLDIGLET